MSDEDEEDGANVNEKMDDLQISEAEQVSFHCFLRLRKFTKQNHLIFCFSYARNNELTAKPAFRSVISVIE